MEKIRIEKSDFKQLIQSFDWNLAVDSNDKRLFSHYNEFNSYTMEVIFDQFDHLEVTVEDKIYGVFSKGQKTLVAKAPFIYDSITELE